MRYSALLASLAWLGTTAAVSADVLVGRVNARVREGAAAAIPVVYAEPLEGTAPARPGAFTIVQRNKSFVPRVLGVPAGSSVAFPNEDPIFHNVFSLSSTQPFDLGLYRSGASKTRTFAQPATYHVFCNIHPQMIAFLVVAPTPWVTTAAVDGSWRLDLPPGRYRVTAVSERAAPVSAEVTVGEAPQPPIALTLDESAFTQATHLNKFGKPYPASAYKDR